MNNGEKQIQESRDEIVRQIQQLRAASGIGDDARVSVYITDTPLVRGILHEYKEEMQKAVNAVDIVQVDLEAGIPLPEEHPNQTFTLGEDQVTIGLEEA